MQNKSSHIESTKLSYGTYRRLRESGEPAIKVYQTWKKHQLSIDTPSFVHQALCSLLPLVVGIMIIVGMFRSIKTIHPPTLWITSPSGNTTRRLPLYQALRVVRERKWRFAEVEPVRTISRREALRILISGERR